MASKNVRTSCRERELTTGQKRLFVCRKVIADVICERKRGYVAIANRDSALQGNPNLNPGHGIELFRVLFKARRGCGFQA